MRPEEWIIYGEVGISSKTIWSVMTGVVREPVSQYDIFRHFDVPHDPDDFKRCYLVLVLFPEWKKHLSEVAEIFPKWGPMVRSWEEMERLHKSGRSKELYELMHKLEDQGRVEDGWIQTNPGSWERRGP